MKRLALHYLTRFLFNLYNCCHDFADHFTDHSTDQKNTFTVMKNSI